MKGFQKAQEIYGAGGYMEFSGYPDFKYSDEPDPAEGNTPKSLLAVPATDGKSSTPTVDVTLRFTEGKQYKVNRIIFTGNTTTRDNVIRRELRLYEGNVFDTESLKYSIKRLNQLGYFKPLEGPGKDVSIDKTPNVDNKVDVKLKLEEQNRNQLTFGAGVSRGEIMAKANVVLLVSQPMPDRFTPAAMNDAMDPASVMPSSSTWPSLLSR